MSSKRTPTKSLFVVARIPRKFHRSKGAFERTYAYFVRLYGQDVVDAVVGQVAPGHMASAKLRRTMRKFMGKAVNYRAALRLARKKEQPIGLMLVVADGSFAVFAPLAPKALVLSRPRTRKVA